MRRKQEKLRAQFETNPFMESNFRAELLGAVAKHGEDEELNLIGIVRQEAYSVLARGCFESGEAGFTVRTNDLYTSALIDIDFRVLPDDHGDYWASVQLSPTPSDFSRPAALVDHGDVVSFVHFYEQFNSPSNS